MLLMSAGGTYLNWLRIGFPLEFLSRGELHPCGKRVIAHKISELLLMFQLAFGALDDYFKKLNKTKEVTHSGQI